MSIISKKMGKYLNGIKTLNHMLRDAANRYYWSSVVYRLLYYRNLHSAQFLNKKVDVIIDGFGGSATSFAYFAFTLCQREKLIAWGQTHAAGHVKKAVALNIPTLILIRDPSDVALSLLQRRYYTSAKGLLHSYIRFYQDIEPYKDRFVIASFQEVTDNYSSVMDRVNQKFDRTFISFEHNEENVQQCFDAIFGNQKLKAVPSKIRDEDKKAVMFMLETEEVRPLLDEAKKLYDKYLNFVIGQEWQPADSKA